MALTVAVASAQAMGAALAGLNVDPDEQNTADK